MFLLNKTRMEEIGATIPKYQPLRVLWRPLCDYARQTILSYLIRPFTRELVPSLFVTRHEKTRLIYTKYTYSYCGAYFLYYIRFSNSVNYIRLPMKSCINGENCGIFPYIYMKLFKFKIQKCGQILCAHKALFSHAGSHLKNQYPEVDRNRFSHSSDTAL